MAKASAVQVRGLRAFQSELRSASPKLARSMRVANAQIAEKVAAKVQEKARARGGVAAKAAPSIVGRGEQRGAKIVINKGREYKFADGAFFGAKQYARFAPWVGNQHENAWPVGANSEGPGGGPYAINPGIYASIPEIEDFYLNAFEDAVAGAFPDNLASLGATVLGR